MALQMFYIFLATKKFKMVAKNGCNFFNFIAAKDFLKQTTFKNKKKTF
jgi:hypothetical protein